MLKSLEVFENEEAEKLLDYFVAYKKLNQIADFFRCAAKVNSEINLHEISQPSADIFISQLPLVEQNIPIDQAYK